MKLSEFRNLIREEVRKVLKEALNKDLMVVADEMWKKLEAAGFKVQGSVNDYNFNIEPIRQEIVSDPNFVFMRGHKTPQYEDLKIYGSKKSEQKILKILDKFQVTPYAGKEMKVDATTLKQVIGTFNAGDIYGWAEPEKVPGVDGVFVKTYGRNLNKKSGPTTVQTTKTGIGGTKL